MKWCGVLSWLRRNGGYLATWLLALSAIATDWLALGFGWGILQALHDA